MASISHTIGGNANLVSFKSAARVPITSLRAHFLPTQEGSGDPSPSNVRAIQGWNAVEAYQDEVYLPKEYQRIEYLESSGTQYFVTNIPIQAPIIIESEQIFTSTSDQYLVGAAYDDNSIAYRSSANGTYSSQVQSAFNGYFLFGRITTSQKYHIVTVLGSETQTVTLGDVLIGTRNKSYATPIDSTKAVYGIFCQYKAGSGAQFYSKVKLYSLKISNATSILGNFIPCYRKSDNEPGMYDTVTQTFFTNQGTGSFSVGPDVGTTIPVTFPVLGKNKFDYANANIVNLKRRDDNGNVVSDSSGSYCNLATPVIPNTEYTISGYTKNNTSKRIYFLDKNQNFISRSDVFGGSSYTFTTLENCYYIQIQNREVENAGWDTVQIELGSTATTYEPYGANNTVYGGYVDVAAGELVAEDILVVIDETTSFTLGRPNNLYKASYTLPMNGANKNAICCSHFKLRSRNTAASNYPSKNQMCCLPYNSETTYADFGLPDGITTSQGWIDFLAENGPITFAYELATPIHYPLVPTAIKALLGPNNIWTNTNDVTDLSYAIHDSAAIRAAKARIAANEPHIVQTAAAPVASFSTDMAAPLKSCRAYFMPTQSGSGTASLENVRTINATRWSLLILYNRLLSK